MIIKTIATLFLTYLVTFLDVIQYIIIIQVIYSWFSTKYNNRFLFFIFITTTTIYSFVRKFIPTQINQIDFTPLIVILGIDLIKYLIQYLVIKFL